MENKPISMGRHPIKKIKKCPCKKRNDLLRAAESVLKAAEAEGILHHNPMLVECGAALWDLKEAVNNCKKRKQKKE